MKILWFANTPCGAAEVFGGGHLTGGWLAALEAALHQQREHELHICFLHHGARPPLYRNGTTYHSIRPTRGISKLFDSLIDPGGDDPLTNEYLTIVNKIAPDVIHVHGSENGFGCIIGHTTAPVVLSTQGILSTYQKWYFQSPAFFSFALKESLVSHISGASAISQYPIFRSNALREKAFLRRLKYVIGRTSWDRWTNSILAPQARYYKCDEILASSFYQRTWAKDKFSTPITIVTIVSPGPYKGLESLLEAAELLNRRNQSAFNWKVVGISEHDSYAQVCMRGHKPRNIEFLGRKSSSEICDLLVGSDIYVQVSHIENSPNGLCEAMLIGVPVIATYAGGTSSVIEDEKEGILVQDGDPVAMAGAIVEFASEFSKAHQYATNAAHRAKERHKPERIAENLCAIYRDIVASEAEGRGL